VGQFTNLKPTMTFQHMREYKGIDLLDKIFEFDEMTPDTKLWTLDALQGNQPRLIRLKQINSLINAFFQTRTPTNFIEKAKKIFSTDKSETIHTILSGDFLKEKSISDFSELVKYMETTVKAHEKFEDEKREITVGHLIMPFQQLVKYKKEVRRLLTFNSGWLEASSMTSRFSIYLTNSISSNLTGKYSELDKALELFINPKQLSFTEDQLIAKFNFPTDNLKEIDMDNW
jgi:hypothetical protein